MSGICGIFGGGNHREQMSTMLSGMVLEGEVAKSVIAGSVSLGICKRWREQTVETWDGLTITADTDLVAVEPLSSLVARYERLSNPNQALLIAAAYRHVGAKVLEYLEGSFSFAIWDEKNQTGFVAVDRVGSKTAFWSEGRDALLFSSRPSGIAEIIGRKENTSALVQFMMFSVVTAPLSAFQGIQRLEAGHSLTWKNGKIKDECYWDMSYPEQSGNSESYWSEQTRERLRGAVRRYSEDLNGRECGAYLSGGTDSSSVTAFLNEVHAPARTYTIYMQDEAFSEIDFARTTASCFKTDHHEECVSSEHALEVFEKLTDYFDEPFANSSAIGGYYCALMAQKSGATTLLAGDGGDEIFAGNERYQSDRKFAVYHQIPGWLRRYAIEPLAKVTPRIGKLALLPKYVTRASLPNPRRIYSYNFLLSAPPQSLLGAEVLREVPDSRWLDIAESHFNRVSNATELNRLLYLDVKITLADNDLRKVVGTAELAGVQVRFPMLDRNLMEFSGTIPSELKLRGDEKRYIFKQAMKPILPEKILYKTKHGFGIPVSIWLLRDKRMNQMMNDILHDQKTRERGFFAPGLLDELLKLHSGGNANYYGEIVWYLLMFEMWCRKHLDMKMSTVSRGV